MSLLETISTNYQRALAVNSVANAWSFTVPGNNALGLNLLPAQDPLNPNTQQLYGSGLVQWGEGGDHSGNRLRLLPMCDGPAGSTFSFRLWGWSKFGMPGLDTLAVWVPCFIAEFLCVSCNQPGPASPSPGISPLAMLDSERLCDTISLTQGHLGIGVHGGGGYINTTGPGTDLTAFAMLDVGGFKYLQFDFQQSDPVGMNCLWARA